MKKRKIIEIYVKGDKNTTTFEFEKVEDTEVTNAMMKALVYALSILNSENTDLEVDYEQG